MQHHTAHTPVAGVTLSPAFSELDGRATPRPPPTNSLLTPPNSSDRPQPPPDAFDLGPESPSQITPRPQLSPTVSTEIRQPVAFSAAHENALEQLKRAMAEHNPEEHAENTKTGSAGRRPSLPIVASDPLSNPMHTTNIYINGLPPNFSEEQLYNIVRQFGNILSVKTFTRAISDKPSGYGFAFFERLEDAENCIRALRRSKDLHPSFSKQVHKIPVRNITPSAPLIPTSRIGLYPPPPLRSQTSPGVLTTLTLTDTVNLNVNGSPRLDLGLSPQFLDLPSSPVSLPELEQTADVAVIGLPMHVDSAKTLQALVAPHTILDTCFFQAAVAGAMRLVAFIRVGSLTAAQEIIARLHGRTIRGLTEPLIVKLANLAHTSSPVSAPVSVRSPVAPYLDVTDSLSASGSRLRRYASVPALQSGNDDVEELRRTLGAGRYAEEPASLPIEHAFTVDPNRAPLRTSGSEAPTPNAKFSAADLLRAPFTTGNMRVEALGRFTPGERLDADAFGRDVGPIGSARLFTPASSTSSAPRLSPAEIAAAQLHASPYVRPALQKRPSKAIPIRAPPPPAEPVPPSSGSPTSARPMPEFKAPPQSPEQPLSLERFPVLQPTASGVFTPLVAKPYDYGALFVAPAAGASLLDFPDSPVSSSSLGEDETESAEDREMQAAGARWLDSWLNEDDADERLLKPAAAWVGGAGAGEALEDEDADDEDEEAEPTQRFRGASVRTPPLQMMLSTPAPSPSA